VVRNSYIEGDFFDLALVPKVISAVSSVVISQRNTLLHIGQDA